MIITTCAKIRRGSLLIEVAMATVLMMIVMTLTVKVTGYVAHERRSSERRERAAIEVGNLMERITAYPFADVTPALARRMTLSPELRQSLSNAELAVDVAESQPGPGRAAKRIAITLRWRGRDGEWVRPVRLTSWIERMTEKS